MKSLTTILFLFILSSGLFAQSQPVDEQIKMAVLAAPEQYREGATIFGFNEEGESYKVREGTNQFVCIADNPGSVRFQVSCYHKSLEPFMERGRELRKEGKKPQEIFDIREEEAKAGILKMPSEPAAMHVYFGDDVTYNEEENRMEGARYRYVVYIPFATQESTGLSLRPNGQGHPWLMDPGTHRAHIMITPPAGN